MCAMDASTGQGCSAAPHRCSSFGGPGAEEAAQASLRAFLGSGPKEQHAQGPTCAQQAPQFRGFEGIHPKPVLEVGSFLRSHVDTPTFSVWELGFAQDYRFSAIT